MNIIPISNGNHNKLHRIIEVAETSLVYFFENNNFKNFRTTNKLHGRAEGAILIRDLAHTFGNRKDENSLT